MRPSRTLIVATVLGLGVVVPPACGGADDPKSPELLQNECQQAVELLCRRACECGSDIGDCVTVDEGQDSETKWGNEDNCLAVLAHCENGGNRGIDYAECRTEIEKQKCISLPSGVKAIERPDECDAPPVPVDAGTD